MKDRLRKIYELAKHGGTDGERRNASVKLGELLKKYDLTLEDLEKVELVEEMFICKTDVEKRLLFQIVASTLATYDVDHRCVVYPPTGDLVCEFRLVKADAVEIQYLFTEYKKLYVEELEIFFGAFCQKHDLLAPAQEATELPPEYLDEYRRSRAMAKGLQDVDVRRRRIGSGE